MNQMTKTIKNYIYNLGYQVLLIIVPLITIPYLSRVLGSGGVGLHGYSNSIVVYFSLVGCLGINIYGQREIAYRKDSLEERTKCFWELVIIRIISSTACSLFYLFFTFFLVKNYDLRIQLLIQTTLIFSNAIDISWYYQGLEEFKQTAIRSMAVKILSVVCIFIFVKKETDLWKYTLILCLSSLLGNLFLWAKTKGYFVKTDFRTLSYRRHLKPIILLFLPQIASSIHTVLDKTMLGFMTNNDEVAYYEQSQKISNLLLVVCTSLNTVLMPKVAYLTEMRDDKKVFNYLSTASQFVLLISFPIAVGVFFISNDFVPLFFGNGYEDAIPVLKIMSSLTVIVGLSNTFGMQFLVPTGDQKNFNISIFLGTGINIILNFLLIYQFKSVGATVATFVSEIIITIYQFFCIKKKNPDFSILRPTIKYFLLSFIMGFILFIEKAILSPGSVRMIVLISSGTIIYFVLLLLTRDKMLLSCFNRIKNKIIRRGSVI